MSPSRTSEKPSIPRMFAIAAMLAVERRTGRRGGPRPRCALCPGFPTTGTTRIRRLRPRPCTRRSSRLSSGCFPPPRSRRTSVKSQAERAYTLTLDGHLLACFTGANLPCFQDERRAGQGNRQARTRSAAPIRMRQPFGFRHRSTIRSTNIISCPDRADAHRHPCSILDRPRFRRQAVDAAGLSPTLRLRQAQHGRGRKRHGQPAGQFLQRGCAPVRRPVPAGRTDSRASAAPASCCATATPGCGTSICRTPQRR